MLKKLSIAAAGSAIATLTAVSGANAVSFSGSGGLVPPVGTSGLFESSITVTDDITIDDISIDFNDLTHTWSGDLIVDLTYDDGAGTVITAGVFDSVGGPTDLNGNYTFADGGSQFSPALPGGISSPDDSFLDAFAGINVAGTWTLSILDQFGGDSGSLGSWDLNVEPVSTPEPASLFALFGIGALGATSLKRKQKEKV
ncbi:MULTISPECIES: proprotein convertase P-domain-containing protein [unclassified Okeania]|uniref:proprotein convertase P-domain-containing protein n=1 Tax=unclassified Okeania TaxID=2634635 RepID=UPI0013BA40F7|nr:MULTISPECIES: proprotein convertase P-domain-containing protein [unclassified Okeania]NET14630.1 PEP-CTERM sorting domain-containing protein [Okeania sp. SIO1H6]NEQ71843.1 PEP-CTERM sorting domain-containing protein [Okeania sp. SIO2C9]NES74544.1 PEP-CTERM sorting domain-containing protein [Okeania sp. SIO1H4]NET20851.1 PEP-CTERM sorting domain-containing protein [Okeania sp. SIO1H5]NET94080.1 PEP-CTERM sorting domain-containing protein [Okeania sp. SIO1H2]